MYRLGSVILFLTRIGLVRDSRAQSPMVWFGSPEQSRAKNHSEKPKTAMKNMFFIIFQRTGLIYLRRGAGIRAVLALSRVSTQCRQ